MSMKRMLFVLGCLTIGPALAAPVPKEKPVIKCELKFTGKIGDAPVADGGEAIITNNTSEVVDIGSTLGPKAYLDLKLKDPKGLDVKTEPLSSLISPHSFFPEPQPHLLKPGESYRAPISLLVMVPEEKRVAGIYKVKAVYTFQKKNYESAEVEVKWPGDKK